MCLRCLALRALCNIEQQTLTANVTDIVGMINDPNPFVRFNALLTLCNVEEAALTAHAGTIESLFANPCTGLAIPGEEPIPAEDMICGALQSFMLNYSRGRVTSRVKKIACSVITNMIRDESARVCSVAQIALLDLQPELVFHW